MVAIGFDLGHTLITYGDIPLSWESLSDVIFIDRTDSKADYGQKKDIQSLRELLEFV